MQPERLLAIFAHPDDETFRPGGTLAILARQGVQVQVLTSTRGEAGSCGEPPLCTVDELPCVRERELHCACAALGIHSMRLMDYLDGHLQEANRETLVKRILSVVDEVKPQVMLSFGPDGISGHPDHVIIGGCASEAFQRAAQVAALYTVAVPFSLAQRSGMRQLQPVPDEAIALTVDISSAWDAKQAAMRCHATQWVSSPMVTLPEENQKLFFGREYFVQAAIRDVAADFLPGVLQGYLR